MLKASRYSLILDPDLLRSNAEVLQGLLKSGIVLNPNDAFLQKLNRKIFWGNSPKRSIKS
jgi:hypothetical protein